MIAIVLVLDIHSEQLFGLIGGSGVGELANNFNRKAGSAATVRKPAKAFQLQRKKSVGGALFEVFAPAIRQHASRISIMLGARPRLCLGQKDY
ncbi:hypothetical protein [Falsirhodobacter xinxiangensis]|uniref:hypothetical protein n=1 Tax=Falsirhodobacter xinxiangensis TaxID=2530049 RepID=UPI0010A9F7A0|nr:hypothetical protein [Rhodobacter xinxiangensis]